MRLKSTLNNLIIMKRFLLHLSLTLGLTATVFAGVVCKLERIHGFDHEYSRAKAVIGSSVTSDFAQCKVYVTKSQGSYYLQSNFVTKGADHPTKIAYEESAGIRDLELYAQNLVLNQGATAIEAMSFQRALEKEIKFVFDQDVLKADGSIPLDLGSAKNIHTVFRGEHEARRLVAEKGPRGPPWLAEYLPHVFVPFTARSDPKAFFNRLSKQPLNASDVKVVSLVNDSAVNQRLDQAAGEFPATKFSAEAPTDLHRLVSESKGKTICVISHTEGDKLITRSTDGREILLANSINDLERHAKDSGCNLIVLGCEAASGGASAGSRIKLNPIRAIDRLETALSESDYSAFVQTLSNADVQLSLKQDALDGAARRAEFDIQRENPQSQIREMTGRLIITFGVAGGSIALQEEEGVSDSPITWWVLLGLGVAAVAGVAFVKRKSA